MFVSPTAEAGNDPPPDTWGATHRRHHRGRNHLKAEVIDWAFWIPMAFIVYYFPPELQLPLSILAVTTWVMLLSVLTTMNRREED